MGLAREVRHVRFDTQVRPYLNYERSDSRAGDVWLGMEDEYKN